MASESNVGIRIFLIGKNAALPGASLRSSGCASRPR